MTHIGNHELNEDESKWLENYAAGVYDRSSKDITSALNKKISADDVKEFLKKHEEYSVEEPKLEEEIEEDKDGNTEY